MTAIDAVKGQLMFHHSMEMDDVIKFLYQSVYGKEHLLNNDVVDYFYEEYRNTPITDEPLLEVISDTAIRVNIGRWKREGLSSAWLINLFMLDQQDFFPSDDALFLSSLDEIGKYAAIGELPFPEKEWKDFIADYLSRGIRPLHHSEHYRNAERPHYRVLPSIDAKVIRILADMKRLDASIVALDGRAASGKSTIAEILSSALGGAGIIRMDDFFLPYDMRTAERLAAPGGNVHYERFIEEVLPHIRHSSDFSYRRFDCSTGEINKTVYIPDGRYRIIEGSYSAHPEFGEYWDLLVFSDIPYDQQLDRIGQRNGAELKKRFIEEWIPMEEHYFSAFGIMEKAGLIL